MAKINLLPPDLGPNASVLKLLNLTKKISAIIGLVFIIFGILFAGYIFFLQTEIKSSIKRSDNLKSSITTLNKTEQGLYLLKDRVGKIKSLLTKETQDESLIGSKDLLLGSAGISFSKVETSQGKITISASSLTSGLLSDFFETVIADIDYKSINLTSFSFNSKTGYVFDLDINLK